MAADIANIAQLLDATLDHKQHRKGMLLLFCLHHLGAMTRTPMARTHTQLHSTS